MRVDKAVLKYQNRIVEIPVGEKIFEEDLYVDFSVENINKGQRLQLTIHPKKTIKIDYLAIELYHPYQPNERIFCNGFQSWTETREFRPDEKIVPIRPIVQKRFGTFGDYDFCEYPNREGCLHSWTYTYIRQCDNATMQQCDNVVLLGSLNEFTGYTLFRHEASKDELYIEKDCAGLELDHSYPALDIFIGKGTEKQQFDNYFKLANISPPKAKPIIGWTSWYHYYTNISEQIILDNLAAFTKQQLAIDIFQIDDGYARRMGDWLSIKPNFPNGMSYISRKIHEENYKAGLWLAPFICEKKSALFKQHPDWILKDRDGKPVRAGWNPLWSGWFYALDFYNQNVQNYLINVLNTVLQKWNYDMVKLDFLYAVALAPPPNKTRGQVMHEAMSFLRNIVGNKLILGCGVPLGSSFGLVDYCRIGADVHLRWEHQLLKWLRGRERVSTILSLQNTLSRWQLDGRAFYNDPDVFILRKSKQKLTHEQQYTLFLINVLLGSVIFTSDNVSEYSEETWEMYERVLKWKDSQVKSVIDDDDFYEIHFTHKNEAYVAYCNLSDKNRVGKGVEMMPFQSQVRKREL